MARPMRVLALVPLLTAAAVALPAAALAAPADLPRTVAAVEGACPDDSGVTVVVDFTDVGGEVEVGCATDAATGTEALTAAGFVDTRDAATMICAIDSLPDPCPTEFTGSYWSYWHAEPGGEWESYMEGSDTTVPTAGSVEGWRYNDGSVGPGIEPPAPAPAAAAAEDPTEDDGVAADAGDASAGGDDGTGAAESPTQLVLGAALAVLLVAAVVVLVRRSRASGFGPAGQD